jgi:hypothetical protein
MKSAHDTAGALKRAVAAVPMADAVAIANAATDIKVTSQPDSKPVGESVSHPKRTAKRAKQAATPAPTPADKRAHFLTPAEKRAHFLDVLKHTANVSRAAREAHISDPYAMRKRSATFARDWDEALNIALDDLEEALRDRAMNGVTRPHFYKGEQKGSYQTYSDRLGMFFLRAHRAHLYKDAEGAGESANNASASAHVLLVAQLDKIAARVQARADAPKE